MNIRKVEVLDHDIRWKEEFNKEAIEIKEALGDNIVEIHHIGSTSIPNIKAKPIIDILVSVKDIEAVDRYDREMKRIGYEAMGEFGIKGRRYFRKGGNNRTHHIHIFQQGNSEIERHITFRDYMIAHPDKAKEYSDLKYNLSKKYPTDIESYIEGKDSFIKDIDKKASLWKKGL